MSQNIYQMSQGIYQMSQTFTKSFLLHIFVLIFRLVYMRAYFCPFRWFVVWATTDEGYRRLSAAPQLNIYTSAATKNYKNHQKSVRKTQNIFKPHLIVPLLFSVSNDFQYKMSMCTLYSSVNCNLATCRNFLDSCPNYVKTFIDVLAEHPKKYCGFEEYFHALVSLSGVISPLTCVLWWWTDDDALISEGCLFTWSSCFTCLTDKYWLLPWNIEILLPWNPISPDPITHPCRLSDRPRNFSTKKIIGKENCKIAKSQSH